MNRHSQTLLGLLTLFFGCKSPEHAEINTVAALRTDSIFYENGKIKVIQQFIDTTRNGYYKSFYPNGALHYDLQFKNGKEHGHNTVYFDNGQKAETYLSDQGKIIGEHLHYYETGGLHKYWFYEIGGHIAYKRTYDTNGNVVSSEGDPLPTVIVNDSSYRVGDTLFYGIFCATPPDCRYTLIFGERGSNFPVVDLTDSVKENLVNNRIVMKRRGHFTAYAELTLVEKKGNKRVRSREVEVDVL